MKCPIERLTKESENIQADINEIYANSGDDPLIFTFGPKTDGLPFIKGATSTEGYCDLLYDGKNKVIKVEHDRFKREVVIGYGTHLQSARKIEADDTMYDHVIKRVAQLIDHTDRQNLTRLVGEIKSPRQDVKGPTIRGYKLSEKAEIISIDYCRLVPFIGGAAYSSVRHKIVSPQSGINYQVLILDADSDGSVKITTTSFVKFEVVTEYGLGSILEYKR